MTFHSKLVCLRKIQLSKDVEGKFNLPELFYGVKVKQLLSSDSCRLSDINQLQIKNLYTPKYLRDEYEDLQALFYKVIKVIDSAATAIDLDQYIIVNSMYAIKKISWILSKQINNNIIQKQNKLIQIIKMLSNPTTKLTKLQRNSLISSVSVWQNIAISFYSVVSDQELLSLEKSRLEDLINTAIKEQEDFQIPIEFVGRKRNIVIFKCLDRKIKATILNISKLIGATPSIYDLLDVAASNLDNVELFDKYVVRDTLSLTLNNLLNCQDVLLLPYRKLNDDFLYDCLYSAYHQLLLMVQEKTCIIHKNHSFDIIRHCLNLMQTTAQDDLYYKFMLYNIAFEELFAVILQLNQEEINKFSFSGVIKQHNPNLNSNFLFSSCMDAFSTALIVSMQFNKSPVYLFDGVYNEQKDFCLGINTTTPTTLMAANLNSSNPTMAASTECIASIIKQVELQITQNDYITLIIDATIEYGEQSINHLINLLYQEIAQGRINILVCKSYQKFASLGFHKFMFGSLGIINNGDTKFAQITEEISKASQDLNFYDNHEYKFLIFMLQYLGDFERKFIQQSVNNATFIKTELPKFEIDISQIPNSTFLYVKRFVAICDLTELFNFMEVYEQDSYAFINTRYLKSVTVDGKPTLRFSVGLETKEQLIETFYCVQTLNSTTNINLEQILDDLIKLILEKQITLGFGLSFDSIDAKQGFILQNIGNIFNNFNNQNFVNNKFISDVVLLAYLYKCNEFTKQLIKSICLTSLTHVSSKSVGLLHELNKKFEHTPILYSYQETLETTMLIDDEPSISDYNAPRPVAP